MNRDELSSTHRLVVKIGSSLLGGDESPVPGLVKQIANLQTGGRETVLVTSGAIFFGMKKLGRSNRPVTLPEKQSIASIGQPHLMKYYDELFNRHGLNTGQVLLTQQDIDNRESYLNASNTLNWMIRDGVIPIVNENDTVATDEIQFGDNDTLASMVTTLVDADLLIILSDVRGLFPNDPETDPDPIDVVRNIDDSIHRIAGPSGDRQSTVGGMTTKVQAAETLVQSGTPMVVASGHSDDVLPRILGGETIGTLFKPHEGEEAVRGRKRWIGYHLLPKGTIQVDRGAAEAIRERGTSLLPSGVIDAEGRFERGDAVRILDEDEREFARGMSNYNPQEVNRIKGCQTDEIFDILGYHDFDEIIHRDNMVVFHDD